MTTYVYTIIALPGSISSGATSINDSGQIVGVFTNSSGDEPGFLYSNGIYTTIVPPGSFNTHPMSINDSGQVIGYIPTLSASTVSSTVLAPTQHSIYPTAR